MSTEILMFHDHPERSRTNRALADAAVAIADVVVTDMGALYATPDRIDLDAEVARLLRADRLVLQFPVQWYSTPVLLKGWQDAVLTRMFYINAADEGDRLKGLPVLVAATAGNVPEAYGPRGANGFPLAELLRPLEATARRCGWTWAEPFLLYRANKLNDAGRAQAAGSYVSRLEDWRGMPIAEQGIAA